MNIQQLEYIVAVDKYRHFAKAAESCFITQATLSMMIIKLEEELKATIFDRSRKPVTLTTVGEKIISHAKIILHESKRLSEIVREEQEMLSGELRIAIIPTLAPFLLPLFMQRFLKKYPQIQLKISELTTDEIIQRLERNTLDAGILSLPLQKSTLKEHSLFFEEFVVYAASCKKILEKKFVITQDIDINRLCLLEEGHCLRTQVFNLCELKKLEKPHHQLDMTTGSIETLKKIVEINDGITILPELSLADLSESQLKNVRHFKSPAPAREIGLVTYKYFVKDAMIEKLKETILDSIPLHMKKKDKMNVVKM